MFAMITGSKLIFFQVIKKDKELDAEDSMA